MSCPEVGRLLQQYLDESVAGPLALDEPTSAKVSGHLDDCRRCGLEIETYESIRSATERSGGGLSEGALARLKDFGERLASDGEPGQA
ncbi:MAG: zf-HC2 domain-containing protein [Actinobacteria bacterium]|nr:zf-HC2 domain-containing protein [Actinomycetota bacterium]MBT4343162.1 zf-HC2 domain-containing protein [Actinomycetota bacterium]MBT4787045.1 zf-HC2 domain-containing protein [Actinomycetota bacterium]MBT6280865.1 zf-HC2 domain-containing protein [Actinomycetota bacterium]